MRGIEGCTALEELYLSHNGIWQIEVGGIRCAVCAPCVGVQVEFTGANLRAQRVLGFCIKSAMRACASGDFIIRYAAQQHVVVCV